MRAPSALGEGMLSLPVGWDGDEPVGRYVFWDTGMGARRGVRRGLGVFGWAGCEDGGAVRGLVTV